MNFAAEQVCIAGIAAAGLAGQSHDEGAVFTRCELFQSCFDFADVIHVGHTARTRAQLAWRLRAAQE
jgi:hypothetical protein